MSRKLLPVTGLLAASSRPRRRAEARDPVTAPWAGFGPRQDAFDAKAV